MIKGDKQSVAIFGAGAVGRGLIGRMLSESGFRPVFIDADKELITQLKNAGEYIVRLTGTTSRDCRVAGFDVIATDRQEEITAAIECCAFAATAVGGQNLGTLGPLMKQGLAARKGVLNILVCENWPQAEKVLERSLEAAGCAKDKFSCVSCSVERMARRTDDPLRLIAEGGKVLYADARAWVGKTPAVDGFVFCDNINAYYARKLYTSNLGHAVLAYLGWLKGCKYVYEAMDVAEIRGHLANLLKVVRDAFLKTYPMAAGELDGHIEELLSWRYSNRDLADTINRVAKSPLRKLGPKERLVAVSRMLEKCGQPTEDICRIIAAAMKYRDEDDPESRKLEKMIGEKGAGAVLEQVCGFGKSEPLYKECIRCYEQLC